MGIAICITIVVVIFVVVNLYSKSFADKKAYHYFVKVSNEHKDEIFQKDDQEISIWRKQIICRGILNGKYSIIQTKKDKTTIEYLCKDKEGATFLFLFDDGYKTLVIIDKHQKGIIFSYENPVDTGVMQTNNQ